MGVIVGMDNTVFPAAYVNMPTVNSPYVWGDMQVPDPIFGIQYPSSSDGIESQFAFQTIVRYIFLNNDVTNQELLYSAILSVKGLAFSPVGFSSSAVVVDPKAQLIYYTNVGIADVLANSVNLSWNSATVSVRKNVLANPVNPSLNSATVSGGSGNSTNGVVNANLLRVIAANSVGGNGYFNEDIYLVLLDNGSVAVSDDSTGSSFTTISLPITAIDMAYKNGVVLITDGTQLLFSVDFETWTPINSPAIAPFEIGHLA